MEQSLLIFVVSALSFVISILIFNLKSPGKRIEHVIQPAGTLDSEVVKRSIGQLLGPPLVGGNRMTPLQNGQEIFPEMLQAIGQATVTINLETFIYWNGKIGEKFSDALIERANAGVEVNVLIDWVGSQKIDQNLVDKMKEAGIRILRYRPLRWYNISRINNRTHRKILVIDGKIGFTGGVGIADQWLGNAEDENHWRDTHFKVEGPVVNQLQSAFSDNWSATHPEVLHGDKYFPKLEAAGDSEAQVFKSSPEEGSGSVRLMYLYSIAHAKTSIKISSAYFVPDSHVRRLLCEALKRGVKVEVIVPGAKIDTSITRRASRAVWGTLLEAGAAIHEYQPTMYHCKFMIVDNTWVSVGSTNMDNRSFRLNDECNLNVIDNSLAQKITNIFEQDKTKTTQITHQQWKNRPLYDKLLENVSWVARSQV